MQDRSTRTSLMVAVVILSMLGFGFDLHAADTETSAASEFEGDLGHSSWLLNEDPTPGYHVFSILATDSGGNVRTADPKLVIVEPKAE